jgi:hypothetical protein
MNIQWNVQLGSLCSISFPLRELRAYFLVLSLLSMDGKTEEAIHRFFIFIGQNGDVLLDLVVFPSYITGAATPNYLSLSWQEMHYQLTVERIIL